MKELIMLLEVSAQVDIVLPGGSSRLSKKVMNAIDIEAYNKFTLEGADSFIFLDIATLNQLEEWSGPVTSYKVPKIFIDHHAPHPKTISLATFLIIDEKSSSTCEIIYNLYEIFKVKPSPQVAKALLVGIAYDSKRFNLGTERMFSAVANLLEINGPLEEVIELLKPTRERSERIAILKASQRLKFYEHSDWILATSILSSFQASAARILLSLGADIVIVAGSHKKKLRASLRATENFHKKTSIHLGRDIALPLGEEFGGAGSGHSTAAGLDGIGTQDDLLQRALEKIVSMLHNIKDS
jgi:nanoRNase/pAp phosphatase (c-di-AMP/oligoRNAs hydrolase)